MALGVNPNGELVMGTLGVVGWLRVALGVNPNAELVMGSVGGVGSNP